MSRVRLGFAAAAAGTAALIATGLQPAPAQELVLVAVDAKEVAQGYRTSELRGKEVLNDARQEIGEIDDFVISADGEDPKSSRFSRSVASLASAATSWRSRSRASIWMTRAAKSC